MVVNLFIIELCSILSPSSMRRMSTAVRVRGSGPHAPSISLLWMIAALPHIGREDGCLMAGLSHLCKQKIHLTSFVPRSSGELSKMQGYKGRCICCPHSSVIGLIRREQKRPLLFASVCVERSAVCVRVPAAGLHTRRG